MRRKKLNKEKMEVDPNVEKALGSIENESKQYRK